MSSKIANILISNLKLPAQDATALKTEFLRLEAFVRGAGQSVSPRGNISRVATGNVQIDFTSGITIKNPYTGARTIVLEPDGDARFGADISAPSKTSLIVLASPQAYNGEQLGEGDILLGDNSSGKANALWDASEGKLKFRGGKTTKAFIATDGHLEATDAVLSGSITANAGSIGGWDITASQIKKTGIILDSNLDQILVGDGTPRIIIDGANKLIKSSNFNTGFSGFNLNGVTGDAEFNSIIARGLIRTAVFQKDVVSSVGGTLEVMDSDVLAVDMTGLDNSTLTIEGNTTFSVGDILRIKDENDDEWFEVTDTSNAPTYTVVRDKAGQYSADSNPTWKKGAAVINYGKSGSGGVRISGGSTPNLSIFTHSGQPWATQTLQTKLGNLRNSYGVGDVDRFGIGIGDYDSGNYLSYNADGGGGFVFESTSGGAIRIYGGSLYVVERGGGDLGEIYFQYEGSEGSGNIGRALGDFSATNQPGYLWVQALHGSGDPWDGCVLVLNAHDAARSKDVRLHVRADATFNDVYITGASQLLLGSGVGLGMYQGDLNIYNGKLIIGQDTNLYREVAGQLKTDGNIKVVGGLGINTSPVYRLDVVPVGATDHQVARFGVGGVTNGFTINYTHATTSMDYAFTSGDVRVPNGDIYTVPWTDYSGSSSVSGWSSFTTKQIFYKRVGHLVFVAFRISGTSNSTSASFTLPFTNGGTIQVHNKISAMDNGVRDHGVCAMAGASNTVLLFLRDFAAWTNSGTKEVRGQIFFEAA